MGDPGGLAWGGRKAWLAVAIAELALILILAAGLGRFVAKEQWLPSDMLGPVPTGGCRRSRRAGTCAGTTRRCQPEPHTDMGRSQEQHVLQKNVINLTQEVTRLNSDIAQQEVEKGRLRDEISAWKNTAQHLQEQKDQYHREVSWLQQQLERHQELRSRVGSARVPSLLPLLAAPLAVLRV